MKVVIKIDTGGSTQNCHYTYSGIKRKWAIIRALNAFRNDLLVSRYEIIDIHTTRE